MKRTLGTLAAIAWLSIAGPARADDKDATPILDRAIAALGGEAKLAQAGSVSWKGSGVVILGEQTLPMKMTAIVEGIDRQWSESSTEVGGFAVKGLTVMDGARAWRKYGNDRVQILSPDEVASTRQSTYLAAVAATILPLKTKDFQVEVGDDEKVGDKLAAVVKATGPDGKPFTLFFDKQTGLPIKIAAKVRGFRRGGEVSWETTYADLKDFDGVKRATWVESKLDGRPFFKMAYTDFKLIKKTDPSTFAVPE